MIVDSQVHVWAAETAQHPWPRNRGRGAHLPEPLTYEKLLPMMDAAGVDRVIIVPPAWQGDRNDYALEAAGRYPDRFAVMGRIALNRPETAASLSQWMAQPGMLGIRMAFNHDKSAWLLDGTADWFWPAAEAAGIPLMIFAPDSPQDIAGIAGAHPRLRIIVDHMGLATHQPYSSAITSRIATVARLARYDNVAVKLSAVPDFSAEPYPFKDMSEHVRRLVEAFGARRCFWGSDLTHSRGKYPYRQFVTHFTEELEFLTAADKRLIMGAAIRDFLGWR
jgi:predicted TIM-barrel fold metal-dependent hydrolase